MLKYILAAIFISTAAAAQEQRTYSLTVTAADVGVIGTALGARPYSEVVALLAKLDAQIKEQDKPKPAPEAAKSADPK